MENIKKFVNTHKRECIIGGIILFILFILMLIFIIAPPIGENNYGNRLEKENKYKISSNTINDIKDTVSKEDGVNKVIYHKEGRILNFTIELDDDIVLDSAKKYADIVIDKLSKKNLKYYDVQVFLNSDNDKFPTIGYHAKGSDSYSWGNAGDN